MKFILAICLLVVMGISGCTADCTLPGTSITLPFCGSGLNAADDVLVIKELRVIPESVTVPQAMRVIASIENRGDKEFNGKATSSSLPPTLGSGDPDVNLNQNVITVDLFDHCTGLFKVKEMSCPGNDRLGTCEITSLLPREIKDVTWVLEPSEDTKLITKCALKVSATYPYTTDGLTTVHFINSQEYLRQVAEGNFKTRTSTISRGLGPVKAWFEIKDQQPIIAAPVYDITGGDAKEPGFVPTSLVIENRGSGIVKSKNKDNQPSVVLSLTNVKDFGATLATSDTDSGTCAVPEIGKSIRLVQNKRMLPCSIKQKTDNDVSKETTQQLNVRISYLYETRAEKTVTVEPAFNPTK